MTTLNLILNILSAAASAATSIVGGGPIPALAKLLVSIAQAASQAHEQVTGQPIDLTLLHPIDPIPE